MKTSVKFTPTTSTRRSAVDRRLALLLVAFTLGWYTRTLPAGLLMGDPGEFQLAAWRFGLAHPTGYPLYLILGGIWQRLLAILGVEPAAAINLLSTVFGALTVGLLYLLMARWLPSTGWGRLSALFAALLFAFNPTFWSQSIIAEVYTLHALLIVAVLLAVADEGRRTKDEGQLSVISDQLSVISHQSSVSNLQSPVPDPQSPIPDPQSPVPSPQSPVPSH